MKIITASKFYYHRAGLESYLFKITNLLRNSGNEVIPFSTTYKENYKTDYDEYFAEYIGLGGEDNVDLKNKLIAVSRIFYNIEAQNKISKLFDATNPDLLWGFGVHRHLSPSIFIEAKRRKIPVIHRLSDYAIICPDSRLTKGDNSNCHELLCPLKGYHNAVKYSCVRQANDSNPSKDPSLAASLVGAAELFFHHNFKLYRNNVSKFIAPSNFLRNTMIRAGIAEDKIAHVPIFINPVEYEPEYVSEGYLLYFGRLSREKGLPLLLEVMKTLKNLKLVLVGDGPQRNELEALKQQQNIDNVEFLGKKHGEELKNIIKKSQAVIVPSTWYENSPNVLLESYALGKPVIGANIGGIPEYVEEGVTGVLYKHDDIEELKEKINYLMTNPHLCKEMGHNARRLTEEVYNPEAHFEKVMKVINSICY